MPVTPVIEIHKNDKPIENSVGSALPLASRVPPTSPKMRDLIARHKGFSALEIGSKSLPSDRSKNVPH